MNSSAINSLYRQEILEHYRHPQNFGKLKKSSFQAYVINELCGDEITLHLLMERGRVKNVKFSGSGCALSIASASLFTERLKGKTWKDLKKIQTAQVTKALGVTIGPGRKKCVLLPLQALKQILDKHGHS
ncbi:MAG: iron-sulfur cluster assembly scaffold protein [Candidatus Doudnabacteria bacterium]|nr:iron-sulfur cluster assembly scaffold protein [Candidatus Doudnabacteria bacterium]